MLSSRRAVVLTGCLCLLACSSRDAVDDSGRIATSEEEALNTTPRLSDFSIYAQRSVVLGAYDSVSGGDIGVRLVAPSAFGSQATVGQHSAIASSRSLLAPP